MKSNNTHSPLDNWHKLEITNPEERPNTTAARWSEMTIWCNECLRGLFLGPYYLTPFRSKWYFKEEQDAVLFYLKWNIE